MIPRLSVSEATEEEAKRFFASRREKPLQFGGLNIELKGHIHVVCREVESEEIVWEVDQPNIITDLGRRQWMRNGFLNATVATSPSSETPSINRYSLTDNGASSSSQSSGAIAPTNNSATNTKTFSNTFATPSATRTIGTIALGIFTAQYGLSQLLCYSVISPAKTQTTSQTLELTYRITMTVVV